MEQRVRVSDKDKKIVRDVMKELFHSTAVSEDEDSMMKTFQTYCQHMMSDLQVLEARYEEKRYPGKKAVDSGKKLLTNVLQQTNPLEFFKTVAGMSEDLIDFAYDYDPIKEIGRASCRERV